MTLLDAVNALYAEFGCWRNALESFAFEGESGMHTMQAIMASLRAAPPAEIAGLAVEKAVDYAAGDTGLPAADVLEFRLAGGAKLMIRPSGTEPKIKLYLSAVAPTAEEADAVWFCSDDVRQKMETEKAEGIFEYFYMFYFRPNSGFIDVHHWTMRIKSVFFCPIHQNISFRTCYTLSTFFCQLNQCFLIIIKFTTFIMHQYSTIRNIIGMKILNLKVVYGYRCFKDFMLYLLYDDILAIEKLQSVSGAELYRVSPSLLRYPERMCRRRYNFFAIYFDVYKLVCLSDKRLHNFFQLCFSGIGMT